MSGLILPLLLVALVIPMFLGRRRQQRAVAEASAFQDSLVVGERVMTTAGLHATLVSIDDDIVELEIAPGIITTWNRLVVKERVIESDELDDENDFEPAELDFVKHEANEA